MLEKLRKLNPDIKLYSIHDDEFKKYGVVIDTNASEIVKACDKLGIPESGTMYIPSVEELENAKGAEEIGLKLFGGLPAQVGICYGHSNFLNGLEYHNSSEINVAATPLVLILGLRYEMDGLEYNSENVKAFYLEKGDVVEVFATTMHFCPCQVEDGGFSCVVVLPKGTNTDLKEKTDDKLLFRNNKWIICHDKNDALTDRGVYPGIHGVNYEIKY
ncbi:MAG: DUF4867 family protein [Clostridia bacterium]|nr:DUF4867 family protein [Clostridia bacterium]